MAYKDFWIDKIQYVHNNMDIVHKSNQLYISLIRQIGIIMIRYLNVKIIFRVHIISYLWINYIVNTF